MELLFEDSEDENRRIGKETTTRKRTTHPAKTFLVLFSLIPPRLYSKADSNPELHKKYRQ
jgi:hypothetical protein